MVASIPVDTSVKELLTKVMPELTQKAFAETNAVAEFAGTEITMQVDTSKGSYSYVLKNGKDIDVNEGQLENPMVVLKVTEDDIKKMITNQELDMLLGMTTDLTKTKYNCIKNLNGGFNAKLSNEDGSIYDIGVLFNGAGNYKATIKMKTADSTSLMRKQANPMSLFMAGGMQIEGDMAFALSVQPLFL
ncbi:MAG: SCP2 sterol-binding domain-containing protein [Proteobacteria bacterium]|nr:SCP2 sterol-binding domain-containing protein [Pseudomonadota bacterium]